MSIERAIRESFSRYYFKSIPENILEADKRLDKTRGYFQDIKGKKILDVGCGKGRYSYWFIKYGADVFGIDPVAEFLKIACRNVDRAKFCAASALDLPFRDNSFDYVCCIEALQHISNTQKAISEMSRVLKSGGKIIIIDNNKFSLAYLRKYKIIFPAAVYFRYFSKGIKDIYFENVHFKERQFSADQIKKALKKNGVKTESSYLESGDPEFINFKSCLRFLNKFIVWKGIKQ
jgi:ubiquinone/menaquinone biosynthesis C-methylase UbiE